MGERGGVGLASRGCQSELLPRQLQFRNRGAPLLGQAYSLGLRVDNRQFLADLLQHSSANTGLIDLDRVLPRQAGIWVHDTFALQGLADFACSRGTHLLLSIPGTGSGLRGVAQDCPKSATRAHERRCRLTATGSPCMSCNGAPPGGQAWRVCLDPASQHHVLFCASDQRP